MHTIDVKLGAYTQFDIDGWKMSIVFVHAKIYWVVNQISYLITFVSGGSYTTSSTTMYYVYRKLRRVVEWTNEASQ